MFAWNLNRKFLKFHTESFKIMAIPNGFIKMPLFVIERAAVNVITWKMNLYIFIAFFSFIRWFAPWISLNLNWLNFCFFKFCHHLLSLFLLFSSLRIRSIHRIQQSDSTIAATNKHDTLNRIISYTYSSHVWVTQYAILQAQSWSSSSSSLFYYLFCCFGHSFIS